MPVLASLRTACPAHVITQEGVKPLMLALFRESLGEESERLGQVFENAGIRTRRLAVPPEWFDRDRSFSEKNARYVEAALELAHEVAAGCLERAEVGPADVDHVVFVSTTGLSTPSLEARLANRLGFRETVRRTPVWGLGCAGGAAGLARACEFARADPEARVLLISLELCSLTFQRNDLSRSNFVATALFADGAAAALVVGDEAARHLDGAGPLGRGRAVPRLAFQGAESRLAPDSLDVMGWEVNDDGFKVVFSRDIPRLVREWVRPRLESFLGARGLTAADLEHMAFHPGGPRVMQAYQEGLGLPAGALEAAREVLRDFGNMSSPTCLFVLERVLESGVRPGGRVLLAALGPGFSAEYVLLRAAGG
jgi:alkylresorcinol/alkylpyrone synthase